MGGQFGLGLVGSSWSQLCLCGQLEGGLGAGRSKTVSRPMAGKLWLALTAVASLQENERRQARALEAQAWNGHSITSTAFCGPEQIIRLALIQGIGKKTLPPGGRSRKVTLRRIGTFVAVFTNDLSHVPCL